MRLVIPLVAMLVAAPALAGCLNPADDVLPSGAGAPTVLPDLSDVDEPVIDAEGARLWWEDFVMSTPYRHAGTPTNAEASERIYAELEAAGYEAHIFYYVPHDVRGVPIPVGGDSPVEQGIRTVIGIKKGMTMPEHVIGWVAHYDSNQATIYAAYDDGSGVAVALELARVLAEYNNSKTLMPIFFDGEEMGLVASQVFVQQAMQSQEYKFDLIIGHDMTGVNCPGHDWPMYQFTGENFADVLVPIQLELYRDVLGIDVGTATLDTPTEELPKNCVVILDGADRNSDERRFKEAGVPVLRMAGGRKATDYPAYHQPNDTIEFLYDFMGGPTEGPGNYELGLELTVRASWWNVVVFDRLPSLGGGE